MILVTGATGNLGAHLAFRLLRENNKIIAIKRKSSSFDLIKKIFSLYTETPDELFSKIEWKNADITNVFELKEAFSDADEVYHCAAYISLDNRNYELSMNTNALGTANIVNLCLEKNIKKLCYVSSIAAIGSSNESEITENQLLNPQETNYVYSLSKYYAEMEVWRGIEEGLNAVIVNPSTILAPYIPKKNIEKFLKYIFRHGIKYYFPGTMGFVDVFDLVDVMITLQKSNINSQRFIVTSENLSYKNIIDYINIALGKKLSKKMIPKELLKKIRNIFFFTRKFLSEQSLEYLYSEYVYSNEKIKKAISFEFKEIQETIAYLVEIYKNKILKF
jgi:nucleoside-diphosphate-sugar epimerase